MTTMAALDRVVYHSVILDVMGVDSYQAREANDTHHTRVRAAGSAPVDHHSTQAVAPGTE
jgi:hypothetical protein